MRSRGPDRLGDRADRAPVRLREIRTVHARCPRPARRHDHHAGIGDERELRSPHHRASRTGESGRVGEVEGERLGEPGHDVDDDELLGHPRVRGEVRHVCADPARADHREAPEPDRAPSCGRTGGHPLRAASVQPAHECRCPVGGGHRRPVEGA